MRNQMKNNNPNWKGGKVKIYCKVCKKSYFVYLSQTKKIKTCSKKCHSKSVSQNYQRENNPCWRGNNAKYHALHYRVKKGKGEPKFCEICKINNSKKVYHWANLTGDFLNINDYKRMCVSCHKKYDAKRRIKKCLTATI